MVHAAADVPAGPASLDSVRVEFNDHSGTLLFEKLGSRLGSRLGWAAMRSTRRRDV